MLTKVKKVSAKKATSSQKTAKAETRMVPKQAFLAPKLQEKNLFSKGVVRVKTVKSIAAKSASKKGDGHIPKESIFPAEFFTVMDELDNDAKKRRAAAYKVMKKAAAK